MMDIPEGEERKMGTKSLIKEIISQNFPNLEKVLGIQILEADRTPCYLKELPSLRNIILKLSESIIKNCKNSNGEK